MKPIIHCAAVCACALLTACAGERDHFYVLNTVPDGAPPALKAPTVHVLLSVSIPPLIDRAEMVISTPDNGLLVLEHERWPVAFSDQVSQTLARDIEMRRSDLLVGDRGFDQGTTPPVTIKVDIVRMQAQRPGQASLEAHWRIVDSSVGLDQIGGDVFDSPVDGGYASVARAYSQALSQLADKLATSVRPPASGS